MINVNDFKTGMTIEHEGNIYQIIEFMHVKPGKGAAFVRTKLKNLRTGSTIEYTFNSGIKVAKANISKKSSQYLYSSGDNLVFMDNESYEQIEIPVKNLSTESKYLIENMNIDIITYNGEMLGVNLPDKVEMTIVKTEPGVKGNTATNATKEAITETGLVVKVPLFINEGERIIVSTGDGKYDSRC